MGLNATGAFLCSPLSPVFTVFFFPFMGSGSGGVRSSKGILIDSFLWPKDIGYKVHGKHVLFGFKMRIYI